MANKRGGPVEKEKKVQILKEIRDLVETGEIVGLTDSKLAQRLNISRQTLPKYLQEVYESIPEEDIQHVQVKIDSMFKKLFRESQKLIQQAETNKEKKEAMDFLLRCIKEFTDFLERFGRKPREVSYTRSDEENKMEVKVVYGIGENTENASEDEYSV